MNTTDTTNITTVNGVSQALHELGELHTVCAFAATDAVDPHIDRDTDELAYDVTEAETFLTNLDSVAAQFANLDGNQAKHVLAGIHASARRRVTQQIHYARHHLRPNPTPTCADPDCWN